MKPIRVYQCRDLCCAGKDRRFWIVRTPVGYVVFTTFRDAVLYAGVEAARLPQEVTA